MRVSLLFVMLALLAGCNSTNIQVKPDSLKSLKQARQRWEAADLHYYSVEVKQVCFCGGPDHYLLVVQDDTVSQVINPENWQNLTHIDHYNTIDDWLAWLQREAQENPVVLELEFDDSFGFPTKVIYDRSRSIADEEMQLNMQNLKRIDH